jgi:adenylosuccinate synthase
MLDCDNGTYPFVTSSHPTAGGACIGAGIGPHMMQNIYGVVKAYSTRVGQGPFPTELLNETGEHIRKTAHEYGTVTGRPRRVGWLDTRAVRYAAALNSFDYLAVTRLDVLDDMDEIQVCTGYEYEGKPLEEYPADLNLLEKVTPVYRTFPGWKTAISDIRSYSELPEKARNYLEAVSELIGVPVGIVSVGPSREQTIVVKDVF